MSMSWQYCIGSECTMQYICDTTLGVAVENGLLSAMLIVRCVVNSTPH